MKVARDVARRLKGTKVRGLMIGRAAMNYPWVFREALEYIRTGHQPDGVTPEERWELILRHCRLAAIHGRYGAEKFTLQAMRSRLMAYSRGLPAGRILRQQFSQVQSISEVEDLACSYLAHPRPAGEAHGS